MKLKEFVASLKTMANTAERVALDQDSRIVILSDLHLGDGSKSDDGLRNAPLLEATLSEWYGARGYHLLLNGDIEELHKFKTREIMTRHRSLYDTFDKFLARGAFRKIVGNHDLGLLVEKDYPYRLEHAIRYEWKGRPLLAYHGHQAAKFFVDYNYLSDFIVRYLANPLRIKNSEIAMSSRRRFKTERRVYRASRALGLVSLIGHTHRPLFESLNKYDQLRFSIETLLRRYALAEEAARPALAEGVAIYAAELARIAGSKRAREASHSLYAEREALIPCLFNSGCSTGKHGYTALEIADGRIGLVHWTGSGAARPYLDREALVVESVPGAPWRRYVIAEDDLDYVFARTELLGGGGGSTAGAPHEEDSVSEDTDDENPEDEDPEDEDPAED